MKAIVDNQRLIVALDFPSTDDARRLVAQLDNSVNFYKVGLELFMAGDISSLSMNSRRPANGFLSI